MEREGKRGRRRRRINKVDRADVKSVGGEGGRPAPLPRRQKFSEIYYERLKGSGEVFSFSDFSLLVILG